ncbi:MAG: ArnT family glycosyltransferase, partial [Chitinophagales bacterium]
MHRIKKYQTEFILTIFLVAFIYLKAPTLTLPYFWDELGVYSRAALYMHDNGLSLMPNALPPELSRGHPLLFTFLNATSFTMFGDNVVTGHCTALFFSILFIIVIYGIVKKTFNRTIALCIAASSLVQPLFVSQSVMVLPEVLLSLCMMLALYFFFQEKYVSYAVVSSLAILVKESAVILPFVVLCSAMIIGFGERKRIFHKKYFSAFFPILVFGVFLLIQKQQNGWFLFPYHASAVSFDKDVFISQLADFSKFLTMEQGRLYITILFLILNLFSLLLNWKNSEWKYVNLVLFLMVTGI